MTSHAPRVLADRPARAAQTHADRDRVDDLVPDLLAPGLRLVFCGTAPSRASAAARAYYAKPGNRFWPALHRAGITPRLFAPGEYSQLLTLGVGLTDLCKHCSGTDEELPDNAFDVPAFTKKMLRHRPDWVAFTSKNAARAALGRSTGYGVQTARIGETRVFVLCSPSGLATRFWREDIWVELGRLARRNR
ncbi:MAG: mismatch-specific DNA-glycosylase [Betaproteobacteria bacterium]|nr:mismatch-specific DNA-glycosylase [Betaproteobacteria bacterium]